MNSAIDPFIRKLVVVNESKNKERDAAIKRIAQSHPISYDSTRREFDNLQIMFPYSPISDIEKLTTLTIECAIIQGIRL